MKLLCLRDFNEYAGRFQADTVLDVTDHLGNYLLSNFPAYFIAAPPPPAPAPLEAVSDPLPPPVVAEEIEEPPKDKMIKRSTKTTRRK